MSFGNTYKMIQSHLSAYIKTGILGGYKYTQTQTPVEHSSYREEEKVGLLATPQRIIWLLSEECLLE